jgi:hypothetical protein
MTTPHRHEELSPRTRDGRDRSVTVCAWCPQLHIMRLERAALDVVMIVQEGKRLLVFRNGESLEVTHAICPACDVNVRAQGLVR